MNTNFSVCDHCGAFVPGEACPHCRKRSFHINKRVAAAALLGTTLFALTPACAYGNCLGLKGAEADRCWEEHDAVYDAGRVDAAGSDANRDASADTAKGMDARADAAGQTDAK